MRRQSFNETGPLAHGRPCPDDHLRFNACERRHLLHSPRLGPVVVARLEQFGIVSIDTMRSMGVDAVIGALSEPGHNNALLNRRRALLQAIKLYY